jgi:hypothetical protein
MQSNLITSRDLSESWCLNYSTLSQWRWNGKGPKYFKIGGRILYQTEDIVAFEEQQLRTNIIGGN